MSGAVAGAWFNKFTDDLSEGYKEIKKDVSSSLKGNKTGSGLAAMRAKLSDNIYYGYSLVSLAVESGDKWVVSREKESVFARETTNYTKVSTGSRVRAMCLVRAKRAAFQKVKPTQEDMIVKYGDIVIPWMQISIGKYARTTKFKGYIVFDLDMPELGEELDGSSCFRITNSSIPSTVGPVKFGDNIKFESCKKPGQFILLEGDYIQVEASTPTNQDFMSFKIERSTDKPSKTGAVVSPFSIAGVDEPKAWIDSLTEGINQIMEEEMGGSKDGRKN